MFKMATDTLRSSASIKMVSTRAVRRSITSTTIRTYLETNYKTVNVEFLMNCMYREV